jgi:cytochrome c-type biogenesis protein CcmH/NrfF
VFSTAWRSWQTPFVACALALTLLAAFPAVVAGAPAPRTTLSDVEQEVMCPTCGTPLMVAQSPLADRERVFIQARIARGETKEQIKRAMVAEFGPSVLAAPPGHGFDLTVYLVPSAGAVLAVLALGFSLTRWRRHSQNSEGTRAAPALPPELGRRLDDDLARYDG